MEVSRRNRGTKCASTACAHDWLDPIHACFASNLLCFPFREAKEEESKKKEAVLKLKEQDVHEHHVKVRQQMVARTATDSLTRTATLPQTLASVSGLCEMVAPFLA